MAERPIHRLKQAIGRTLRNALSDYEFWQQRRRFRGTDRAPSVLIVDQQAPDPRLGAGYPRAHAIVSELAALGCQVGFYAIEAMRHDVARMRTSFGGQVHFFPPSGTDGLQRVLRNHGASFDMVLVSRPGPITALDAGAWRPAATGRPFLVYDAEAVLAPREVLRRGLFGGEVTADEDAAVELAPARIVDAAAAVGPGDAAIISETLRKPVVTLSHVVQTRADTPGHAARADFLFVGRMSGARDRSHNVDSVVWFVTEVMPILDGLIGRDYRLQLAGLLEAPEIEALRSDRIIVHGAVDDLAPLYDRCRVFVAPTRYCNGLPLKLVEAMGQHIACVGTSLLGEQLALDQITLPTGGSAEAFARACARVCDDAAAWSATRDAALRYVEDSYSRARFRAAIEQLFALLPARTD